MYGHSLHFAPTCIGGIANAPLSTLHVQGASNHGDSTPIDAFPPLRANQDKPKQNSSPGVQSG